MKKLLKLAPLLAAALGLVALLMLFLPAVTTAETSYNGLKVVFGYTEETKTIVSTIKTVILEFSFMNLLTYLLVIGGIVLSILNKNGKNKLFFLIATACFIVAAILFLCTVSLTVINPDLVKLAVGYDIKETWKLGAGAIIAAITSILAGLISILPVVMKK